MSSIMDYNGYHAKVEYDGRDNIFVGTVIGLNDMLGFHGASVGELNMSFKNCMLMCNGADKMIYYRNVEQKESEIKNILKIISREEFEKRVSSKNIVFVNQNKEELIYHGGHD